MFELETGMPVSSPMQHSGAVDGAFSGDGRRISTVAQSGKGQSIHVWELTDPRLPKDEMVRVAKLVSGRTIDESGATSPLDPAAHQELLFDLRSRYPGEFRRSDRNIKHWYEQQSRRIESELRWLEKNRENGRDAAHEIGRLEVLRRAALWYLNRLMNVEPSPHADLDFRRGRTLASLGLWSEAAEAFSRSGDRWESVHNMAICQRALGLWDAAAVSYAQTIQLLARLPGPKRGSISMKPSAREGWDFSSSAQAVGGRLSSLSLRPSGRHVTTTGLILTEGLPTRNWVNGVMP